MTILSGHPLDLPMRRFVWRRRRLRAAGAACLGGAIVLAWLIAGGLIDRFARLPAWPRVVMLAALLLVLAASFMRVVMLLIDRRFNRQIAAGQIEAIDQSLGERLMTVITQDELPPAQRGSPQLTAYLAQQVVERLHRTPPDRRLTWRFVRPAIVLLVLTFAAMVALFFVPQLGLPRLLARQLFPLADLPPVTTTRIDVVTGSVDLPQGQPLAVVADVTIGDGPVTLLIGSDDSHLQPIAAARVFGGRYSATVRSIETDQVYRVQAGDATSAAYHIRVMRRPGIVRLGLMLTFPDYLHQPPMKIEKSDGRIDAVRGTRVRATVVGTEPLRQVTAALPEGTLPGDTTVDPAVRTLEFTVGQSGPWSLNLVSERGVTGSGPGGMRINAVEDKPPVVRLLKSDLRFSPSDVAALPFEAADDFGLQSLRLEVTTIDKPAAPVALNVPSERRLVRDVATVDLAPLAAAYGDVVSVTLVATDIAGQTSISAPCRVLISPRSTDARAERRGAALQAARELTESAVNDPGDSSAAVRAMLRAIAATDAPAASNFLQQQVDAVQQASSAMTWAGQTQWTGDQQNAVRNAAAALRTLERGERAKSILADLENIQSAGKTTANVSAAEKSATQQSVQRARREIAERMQALQLLPGAEDTPDRLRKMVAGADAAVNNAHAPSAAAAARDWAAANGPDAEVARDRVALAAQAEVLRGDADLTWARDLQLLARAMTAVAQQSSGTPPASSSTSPPADVAETRERVKDAAAALETAHQTSADPHTPPDVSKSVSSKAADARQALAKLTGESAATAAVRPSLLEDALAAPAELQQEHESPGDDTGSRDHAPEKWKEPDDGKARASHENAQNDAAESHAADTPAERKARSLDRAAKDQKRLGDRTQQATPSAGQALAQEQQDVAQKLKQIEAQRDDDFFQQPKGSPADQQQMLEQLRQMQRDLANLPQQMLQARSAAQSAGEQKSDVAQSAARQQAEALANAGAALGDKRSSGAAHASAAESTAGSTASAKGGSAQSVSQPAATAAVTDAVKALSDQLAKGDLPAADAAQAKALESVAALQATLRTAQRQVVDRDPVVAARYFAEQAAAELKRDPPDLLAARADQQAVSGALERAWGQAMQRAVHDRLGRLPSFQSLLDDDLPILSGTAGPSMMPRTAAPQWGRLRSRRSADVSGSESDFQPAGYEGALSAYFDALGKARASGGGK